jgi:hypothetical protein
MARAITLNSDMRSFDLNHIAIAAADIPPDATMNDGAREVRPQDPSGVVVKFPMKMGSDVQWNRYGKVPLIPNTQAKDRHNNPCSLGAGDG